MENGEIGRRLAKLEQDLWHGNGKPGITIRIAVLENRQDDTEEAMNKIDEALDKWGKKTDRLSWLVAVGVGILIALQFILKR
jgi:hypothetical protein